MRNVFLVLVLVNLVVLAYMQWVVERPEPRAPFEGPGITLLREADRGDPATILVSDGVAAAVGAGFALEPVGRFAVKGRASQVQAFRLAT